MVKPLIIRGNLMCAVDVETTGLDWQRHDIWQIAVVPLDTNFEPWGNPFYSNMRPHRIANIDSNALSGEKKEQVILESKDHDFVRDLFIEWHERLAEQLGFTQINRLIPIGHNFTFDYQFLSLWLGGLYSGLFHAHQRDTMLLAANINDYYNMRGQDVAFKRLRLEDLCEHAGILNPNPHDALCDAIATAALYKYLMWYKLPEAMI